MTRKEGRFSCEVTVDSSICLQKIIHLRYIITHAMLKFGIFMLRKVIENKSKIQPTYKIKDHYEDAKRFWFRC